MTQEQASLAGKWQDVSKEAAVKSLALFETQENVNKFFSAFENLEKSIKVKMPEVNRDLKSEADKNMHVEDQLAAAEVCYTKKVFEYLIN